MTRASKDNPRKVIRKRSISVAPENYSQKSSESTINIMQLAESKIRRASIRSSKSMGIRGSKISSEAEIREEVKPRPVRL